MSAKRLISYLTTEAGVDWNADLFHTLVLECQISCQLDSTFEGVTPLCVACCTKCEAAVGMLLSAGASVNLPSGYFGRSPLHYCVDTESSKDGRGRSVATAEQLLRHGADVNQKDAKQCTPLHLACQMKNEECADLLIRNGAKLNETDDQNETPLIKACKSYSHGVIEKVVEAGCDINHDFGAALKILLKSTNVSLKSVEFLISKGANLKVQNYLCTACSHTNNADAIEYLISQGADVNDRGNLLKITALHHACISPKVKCEIVELLLQHGADVNAISETGDSALHYACQAVSLRKVQVLLNWGGNIHHVDDCNFTPLGALLSTRVEEGLFGDYMTIANLLLAAGATLSDSELETVQQQIPVPLSPSQIELNIAKFIDKVQEQCKMPGRLSNVCRIKVRSCIAGRKDTQVKDLCLPRYLKELLLFSDIGDCKSLLQKS